MIGLKRALLCFLILGASGAISNLASAAPEEILSFRSRITVQPDSSMTVRETIRVRGAGRKISHGIYRDFPTRYRDRAGNRYRVDFRVLEVRRDGNTEGYHIKRLSNGERVYLGRKNVLLPPGEYTYTIVYRTSRQIGYFKDHDELYWNVTGNGWDFPIEEASAVVELPPGIPADRIKLEGYTGPRGSKEKAFRASLTSSGEASFTAARPLAPREGLTIVVSWPRGFVRKPPPRERAAALVRDNLGMGAALIGLLALLLYYLVAWALTGKDPPRGTIIPLFQPPKGFSPAGLRYLVKMGYDHQAFAAALIDMAVKGFLKIREAAGVYTLEKIGAGENLLAGDEQKIAARLFKTADVLELRQKNRSRIRAAARVLRLSLKNRFKKIYFIDNRRCFVPGVALSVVPLILVALSPGDPQNRLAAVFVCFWLTFWSIGAIGLLRKVVAAWKGVSTGGRSKGIRMTGAILLTLFSAPFFAGECVGLFLLAWITSLPGLLIIAGAIGADFLFHRLLKAPTRAGRDLLDRTDGFRMFLSVAEKDRLKFANPPERTPELFERYLPYALALDVEQPWAEQFSAVLARAGEAGGAYRPGWYSGPSWSGFGGSAFVSSLGGTLSSAIASSSTAPGSSSGSGGGGSSGGGGGGGGGGGW